MRAVKSFSKKYTKNKRFFPSFSTLAYGVVYICILNFAFCRLQKQKKDTSAAAKRSVEASFYIKTSGKCTSRYPCQRCGYGRYQQQP